MCGGLTLHRWFTSKYPIFNKLYYIYPSISTSVEGVEGMEGKSDIIQENHFYFFKKKVTFYIAV